MTDAIRDAAAPLAHALTAMQDAGLRVPPADVLISYTHSGCIVRVADRSARHREAMEEIFRNAFVAAGWGVWVRYAGGLTMQHPATMTRL
ncbi:hypothetical protein [Streptomyces misionensis]|uniref:hypothetical protein n=1 Tax=Streptomyces misionensis TaxID=67331 RepID=UPI0036898DDC